MMNDNLQLDLNQCGKLLKTNNNFLLVTHVRPDGDTIGSAVALCLALGNMGKTAYLYNNTQVTSLYRPFFEPLIAPAEFRPDYVVTLDLANESLFPGGFDMGVDLSIDHHGSNSFYAESCLVDGSKASCGELVCDVICSMGISLTPEISDALYIAVSTDTGCFCYDNTTADTHRIAAELINAGARSGYLNKILFRTASITRMKLESLIVSNISLHHDGRVAIAPITLEMMESINAGVEDCDDLSSFPGRISGVAVGITMREITPERYRVSVRTGPDVNANDICRQHGGGGHRQAAGCTVTGDLDTARTEILNAVEVVMK